MREEQARVSSLKPGCASCVAPRPFDFFPDPLQPGNARATNLDAGIRKGKVNHFCGVRFDVAGKGLWLFCFGPSELPLGCHCSTHLAIWLDRGGDCVWDGKASLLISGSDGRYQNPTP